MVEGEASSSQIGISPPDIVPENTTMNTPVVSIPPFKEEENPYSPDLDSIPLDEEMFPSLETPDAPMEPTNPVPVPAHNYILLGGLYYQQVPPPHNVVVSQSAIPTPALIPVTAAPPAAPVIVPTTSATAELQAPPTAPSEVPLPLSDDDSTTKGAGTPKDGIAAAAAALDPEPEKKTSERPAVQSQDVVTDQRRSRPRSRSTSSCQSDKHSEVVKKPQGVALSDAGSKKVRGIGRGKPKNQGPLGSPINILGQYNRPTGESPDHHSSRK